MRRMIFLHTNDMHARVEGMARVATLVEQVRRENPDTPVLYFDLGDSEDTVNRLSNLTKGVAMHRLLSIAGCDASAVGNAAILRYGYQVLAEEAQAANYPLLLANLRLPDGSPIPGTTPTTLLDVGGVRLGLIGVTANIGNQYEKWFGLQVLPVVPLIRELSAALRQQGADAVVLLSHLGHALNPEFHVDEADRAIAAELQQELTLILGAHSHHLLPEGEWVGDVLIAQAGEYAQHLGRVDLLWDGARMRAERATVLPVADVPQSPRILAEAEVIEGEVERFLQVVIGELAQPLDFAADRECGVGNLMADMLRERMRAEVGVVAVGQAFSGPLPAGPLHRVTLWDACSSPANSGVTMMTGAQLTALVARGLDAEFAKDSPRAMRGQPRGLFHLSGASVREGRLFVGGAPVEPERLYRVAGSDWELDTYGGYADASWNLEITYDVPVILREALEDYFAAHRPVYVTSGRIQGSLRGPEAQ